jgi:hypothetical protein
MRFLGFFTVLFSLSVWAGNPLIHYCNLTYGEFHTVKMNSDQVGFCEYGSAVIDALSIFATTTGQSDSMAAQAAQAAGSSCADANGNIVAAEDLNGQQLQICLFADGSALEVNTLQLGALAPANRPMIQALQTRFP